jgi:hypothetical protein
VPGAAALNVAGNAGVNSVSCPSAGGCAAGGSFATGPSAKYPYYKLQAFVVSEQDGVWGTAIVPPGLAALNVGSYATVSSVSCARAGNCAAGGEYTDGHGIAHAFVVSEKDGVWGAAIEVTAALKGGSSVASVSCVSPGNCTAGGSVGLDAFVVSEKNGTWRTAFVLKGAADRSGYNYATVSSVSCAGVGDCVAGGYTAHYSTRFVEHAFVAVERNGTWADRRILATANEAQVISVSCANPGNCAVVGYASTDSNYLGFVADEKNGSWGAAQWVGGGGSFTIPISVSCASPGNCLAGVWAGSAGDKYGDGGYSQAYLVSEENGKWGNLFVPPGVPPGDPDLGPWAAVTSVSCASPGNCVATGFDSDASDEPLQDFVVAERNGVWGTAEKVPGTATLGLGPGDHSPAVSCAWAGNCAIGGSYGDGSGHSQVFVTAP